MKTIFTTMKKTGQKYRLFLLFYTITVAVIAAAIVFTNLLQGEMAESALDGDVGLLVNLLLLITAIAAARALFSGLRIYFVARFNAGAGYNMRKNFIKHFLRAPFAKVEKSGSGEALSVYQNDVPPATELVTNNIFDLIEGLVDFGASLAFLLVLSPFYTGVMVLFFIGMVILIVIMSMPMRIAEKKSSEKEAAFNAVVNDSLQNLSVIAAYSLDENVESRYMAKYKDYMRAIRKVALALIPMLITAMAGVFAPIAAVNVIMAFGVIEGSMSIAEFLAYTSTIMLVVGGISQVAGGIGAMASTSARAKRVLDNSSHPEEDLEAGGKIALDAPLRLAFESVTFSYPPAPPKDEDKKKKEKKESKASEAAVEEEALPVLALEGVSFEIKPGSRVAFVGGSGSGKSTVLKLLMGLYQPDSGRFTVDSKEVSGLSMAGLRDMSAYVPQDSFLFPESIGENIGLTKEFDIVRLEEACKKAGILDFINSLPEGFNSVLAESSENISGGQRQRIAMARAFYKNAPVILFDEATSSLDPNTESAILESLNEAAKGKTVIMVAHRARAIAACDVIVVLENGRVAGIGSHEELMAGCAAYRNLYEDRNGNGGGR